MDDLRMEYKEILRLFYDNKSTICMVKDPVHNDRTKHVEIDSHVKNQRKNRTKNYTFELYTIMESGCGCLYQSTTESTFQDLVSKLGLINIYEGRC